jgi:hypothetical protein
MKLRRILIGINGKYKKYDIEKTNRPQMAQIIWGITQIKEIC